MGRLAPAPRVTYVISIRPRLPFRISESIHKHSQSLSHANLPFPRSSASDFYIIVRHDSLIRSSTHNTMDFQTVFRAKSAAQSVSSTPSIIKPAS
jgi:hypothetical protein